jgi:hypothetical protein
MAVEIEVLPLDRPEQNYAKFKVRYLVMDRPTLEMDSSVYPQFADRPLLWLEKAIKTRCLNLSEVFGNWSDSHLLEIEQARLSQQDFDELQEEIGIEACPYPFLYTLDVLVNPDPGGLVYAGIGMHLTGLTYTDLHRFLIQFRDEVQSVFTAHHQPDD